MTPQTERPTTPAQAVAWTRSWLALHSDNLRGAPRTSQVQSGLDAYVATFSPLRAIDHMNHLPVVKWVAQELIDA